MKMKRISAMIQDGTFMEYKTAVLTAELYKDTQFKYRGEVLDTRQARLEITFAETFMDSIKNINDDNISRSKQLQ